MIVTVTGIGLWTRGMHGWRDFQTAMDNGFAVCGAEDGAFEAPKPQAIPARERRRAGLTINLAVEVMHQACDMAGADKSAIASVFTSAMGDTDITDYMCRKLASDEKLLSPTRFHNSVHNAASGYWSISAANHQPSSFVGGFRHSFASGLLEAASCAVALNRPTGLAAYDVVDQAPLDDVLPISETLALALLVTPGETPSAGGWRLALTLQRGAGEAALPAHEALRGLAAANPMGTGLALLEAMAAGESTALCWPVSAGASLHAQIQPC